MPISNIGNPLKTSINELRDGTLTSKNMISKSNTSQLTPYPDHLMPTKGKTTTKMSHSSPQKDS
jgi:hypothetical protein